MNIFGALQCMMDGKRVKNEAWDDGEYIYVDKSTGDILDEEGEYYPIRYINEDDTWEIYEEKEKNMISNDKGGFIYVYECKDDENFINIRMEANEGYNEMSIELYKDDVKELINILINLL